MSGHNQPDRLVVYPQVRPIEELGFDAKDPFGELAVPQRLFEDPNRTMGVREYRSGDSYRYVHWKATARTGALHCKVLEPSTLSGITVLLDFHKADYHARGEPFRSELAVTATLALANAVYEMGQQVGLVTNGRDAADRIRTEGWQTASM